MTTDRFRFDDFLLDARDRRLIRDGRPLDLNARYLDALTLLVREQGRLVTKERFLAEVWRGVPVTDEALTQCVRSLRRLLGDHAGQPRFIETVPKHGYRFIAPVSAGEQEPAPASAAGSAEVRALLPNGVAGTIGGGVAGLIGGLLYGFAAAHAAQPAMGAASALLVVLCVTTVIALVGGGGVAFGIAAAPLLGRHPAWAIVGGGAGGLVVGAVVNLVGVDAFNLLLGHAPGAITGGPEGALLGAAIGAGAWLGAGGGSVRRNAGAAALLGGIAGLVVTLTGGRLMAGSLDQLGRHFPGSRLRLDTIGRLLGEPGFGPTSEALTAMLEGALFGGCIVGAMALARRLRP